MPKPRKNPAPKNVKFELVKEKSTPRESIFDFAICIFGRPKIGKTTLSARVADLYHFMFERGAEALELYQSYIPDWETWINACDALADQDDYKNISIDVVDMAYERCVEYVLRKNNLTEIPDDYGRTHGKIRNEFLSGLLYPKEDLGLGVLYIAHARESERKTLSGDVVTDVHVNLTGKTLDAFTGTMDALFYYTFERGHRVLQLVGDDNVHCGHRFDNHFNTVEGDPIHYLPLGDSPEESFNQLMRGFNNEVKAEELTILKKRKGA